MPPRGPATRGSAEPPPPVFVPDFVDQNEAIVQSWFSDYEDPPPDGDVARATSWLTGVLSRAPRLGRLGVGAEPPPREEESKEAAVFSKVAKRLLRRKEQRDAEEEEERCRVSERIGGKLKRRAPDHPAASGVKSINEAGSIANLVKTVSGASGGRASRGDPEGNGNADVADDSESDSGDGLCRGGGSRTSKQNSASATPLNCSPKVQRGNALGELLAVATEAQVAAAAKRKRRRQNKRKNVQDNGAGCS